ncbi:hypothetical protein POM88_010896 [Heracleum sosnowskyi]|uniref:F-box domain-containing protein n=1 Tax=Heracleum sosnowskyi TaxID=360622 RepID=A0AAD8IXE4_9APIA|nr:hypothetical protein POM88_010896 [Heracleum sosnowskyi]
MCVAASSDGSVGVSVSMERANWNPNPPGEAFLECCVAFRNCLKAESKEVLHFTPLRPCSELEATRTSPKILQYSTMESCAGIDSLVLATLTICSFFTSALEFILPPLHPTAAADSIDEIDVLIKSSQGKSCHRSYPCLFDKSELANPIDSINSFALMESRVESVEGIKRVKQETDISNKQDIDISNILPEAVFSNIVSWLPVKEAVKTSVLVKRWKRAWKYATRLDLDPESISKPNVECAQRNSQKGKKLTPTRRSREDLVRCTKYYTSIIQSIQDEVTYCQIVHFPINVDCGDLKKWVKELLMKKNVKALSLKCYEKSIANREKIVKPLVLRAGIFSPLESLELTCYTLSNTSPFQSCEKLRILKLSSLVLGRKYITKILSLCKSLEELSMLDCQGFSKLEISSPSLKFLELRCLDLENINISAEALTTLILYKISCRWSSVVIDAPRVNELQALCNVEGVLQKLRSFEKLRILKLSSLILGSNITEIFSLCKSLEELSILDCHRLSILEIFSQNLKVLELRCLQLKNINISAEALTTLILYKISCRWSSVVIDAPRVTQLQAYCNVKGVCQEFKEMYLSQEKLLERCTGFLCCYERSHPLYSPQMGYSSAFHNLQSLSTSLDLNDIRHAILLSYVLRVCFRLKRLDVTVEVRDPCKVGNLYYPEDLFWEKKEIFHCISNCLRTVSVQNFRGEVLEMEFVRYVITRAQRMHQVTVRCADDCTAEEVTATRNLLSFPKSSMDISVVIVPPSPTAGEVASP